MAQSLLGKRNPLMAGHSFVWRVLWTSVLGPRIKLFIWKQLHDILPCFAGLISRGVEVDAAYQVCENYDDLGFHILLMQGHS